MTEKELVKKKPHYFNTEEDCVTGLEMSNQGIKAISKVLCLQSHLKEIILNNNNIHTIPGDIKNLINLEVLNLSNNKITTIPPEMGRLVSLRELYINDNSITGVPLEIGNLYKLQIFNISNNPLIAPFCTLNKDGTLLRFCRENNTTYKPPNPRLWTETDFRSDKLEKEVFSVGSYNILNNHTAEESTYTPSWVIESDSRRKTIVKSISTYKLDILCIQEMDSSSYYDFYRDTLFSKEDFDSSFFEKPKKDKKMLWGNATFWKKGKFQLIEEFKVDYSNKLHSDGRFFNNYGVLGRYAKKDNTALISVLSKGPSQILIVANTQFCTEDKYFDLKLIQCIFLLEDLEKVKNKYRNAAIILAGSLNVERDSSLYNLVVNKTLPPNSFTPFNYGPLNDGFQHTLRFDDAYEDQDGSFTVYTPFMKKISDYIFHTDGLKTTEIVTLIEDEYCERTVGFPNIHFPSIHVLIATRFYFKPVVKKVYTSLDK